MEATQKTTYTHSFNAFVLTIRTLVRFGRWNIKAGGQFTFTCSFMGDGSVRIGLLERGIESQETISTVIQLPHELSAQHMEALLQDICSNIYAKLTLISEGALHPDVALMLDQMQRARIAEECGVPTTAVASLWQKIESLPLVPPLFSRRLINGEKLSVVRIDCKA